jgi:hypothetical protein
MEERFHSFPGQALAGLNVSRVVLVDGSAAVQPQKPLNLADDLPAGGARLEHLPDEAFEGQTQVEAAIAAIGTFICLGKKVNGDEGAQLLLELGQGGLAELLGNATARRSEFGAKSREERSSHTWAVYIPPH